jgi:hypothetical protein
MAQTSGEKKKREEELEEKPPQSLDVPPMSKTQKWVLIVAGIIIVGFIIYWVVFYS